jgi:hypothetical protein
VGAGGSVLRVSPAGDDEARLVREDHRLDTVTQAEFRQEIADVCLDGVLGDMQLDGDFQV